VVGGIDVSIFTHGHRQMEVLKKIFYFVRKEERETLEVSINMKQ
jgi:hypothetical protein